MTIESQAKMIEKLSMKREKAKLSQISSEHALFKERDPK